MKDLTPVVGEINKSEAFVDELGATLPSSPRAKEKPKGKEPDVAKSKTLKLRDEKTAKKKAKASKKDLQIQSKDAQLEFLRVS